MQTTSLRSIHVALLLLAVSCGPKAGISETRMIQAPSREPTCSLELVQVDLTSVTFNQEWDTLGYVTLIDKAVQDPAASENRELVRPRACAMGGTAVAVSTNAAATNQLGQQGSGLVYMVLRPKSPATPPSKF